MHYPPSRLSGTAEYAGMKSTAAYLLFTVQNKTQGESLARPRSEIDGKWNKEKQREPRGGGGGYKVSLERSFLRLCPRMTD